ncbi:hypothetical protein CRG98_026361 [Punica granatum]|uniref:Uncharacterized protein n=1 Tax=Punica granatum TaxID=22663 RepID=A0A2I0JAE3_PUNGR|nr:hypothetical protein CRG98_026361 [Punica granatum]
MASLLPILSLPPSAIKIRSIRRTSIETDALPISSPHRTQHAPPSASSFLSPTQPPIEPDGRDGDSIQSCWRSRTQARQVRVSTTFGATTPMGGGDRKDDAGGAMSGSMGGGDRNDVGFNGGSSG